MANYLVPQENLLPPETELGLREPLNQTRFLTCLSGYYPDVPEDYKADFELGIIQGTTGDGRMLIPYDVNHRSSQFPIGGMVVAYGDVPFVGNDGPYLMRSFEPNSLFCYPDSEKGAVFTTVMLLGALAAEALTTNHYERVGANPLNTRQIWVTPDDKMTNPELLQELGFRFDPDDPCDDFMSLFDPNILLNKFVELSQAG